MDCPHCRQAKVVAVRRYGTDVEWYLVYDQAWNLSVENKGSHFHVECERGCHTKLWADQLTEDLRALLLSAAVAA